MRNYFTLNGQDSRDFGVYISGQGAFSAPSRANQFIQIPGRNGDLIGYEKRLENMEVVYPAFIYSNFKANLADFRAFLLSLEGYVELSDTYNPDEFRLAAYVGPFNPEVTSKNDAGQFDISFICKPQRFLKTGKNTVTFTADGTITNPTRFDARPLLRVYGVGSVGIGGTTINIFQADEYTDIDSEMMDCFKGSANKNANVTFSGYDFPVLHPGSNGVALSGVTKVEITPRWWTV